MVNRDITVHLVTISHLKTTMLELKDNIALNKGRVQDGTGNVGELRRFVITLERSRKYIILQQNISVDVALSKRRSMV